MHAAGGSRAGLSAEQLATVPAWRESGLFSERESLAMELAEAMTVTPPAVTDALFDRLRGHFDPGEIVELSAAIAFENFRARFNRVFEVEPQGFAARPD